MLKSKYSNLLRKLKRTPVLWGPYSLLFLYVPLGHYGLGVALESFVVAVGRSNILLIVYSSFT